MRNDWDSSSSLVQHRYQTAAGTGSSIQVTDKTIDTCTLSSICPFPPSYLFRPALLDCFCTVFLFKFISCPDFLPVSGPLFCHSLTSYWLNLPSHSSGVVWEWKEQTHRHTHRCSHLLCWRTYTKSSQSRQAGDPQALHSSLGHTNLISWHIELGWCKLVCFLCFSRLYLLLEGFCSLGQQVVDKLGAKGSVSACFPVYQILSFRLYRQIDIRFEATAGRNQDISLTEFVLKCVKRCEWFSNLFFFFVVYFALL